ncbi:GTP-binding protein 10-like isoform X2 [Varroa destructor]|uniref:GTP-binding protein 10 n=1 Tax=Varroa destructor TaxID=109461 RepID=A0A7M7JG86_VARDE|nr:GTP-binding protein 10-like isoform X2 [Varroa destructor]
MVWRTLTLRAKQGLPVVLPSEVPKAASKKKAYVNKAFRETSFIERVRLKVFAGAGGSGYPKINGVGGNGGSVYVKTIENITLHRVLQQYPDRRVKAGVGENSRPHVLLGKAGEDAIIEVPPGVSVVDSANRQLVDLVDPGEKFLIAKGGLGGSLRNGYNGRRGQEAIIGLYLKLIADIGFVGFPNAGKSTLLRGLSRARPKVANYPFKWSYFLQPVYTERSMRHFLDIWNMLGDSPVAFTTLRPNIGTMEYEDFRQITLADLPGLIEGAHQNAGLGYNFLRHVERTSLLLFVVDVHGFQLNERSPYRNAFETVMSLNKELELYRADLVYKPALLVLNKMDTDAAMIKAEEFTENMASQEAFENLPDEVRPKRRIDFKETVHISAKNMENVKTLQENLRAYLDELFEASRSSQSADRAPIQLPYLTDQLV